MIRKYLTGGGARVAAALFFIGLATSGCASYFTGHAADGINQVSIAGSCNNPIHPTSKLYTCTGAVSGQLLSGGVQDAPAIHAQLDSLATSGQLVSDGTLQRFTGRITGCTAGIFCFIENATCHAIQTDGQVDFAGTGLLGTVPVKFTMHATAQYGHNGTLQLTVVQAQPPHSTLFTRTFQASQSNIHITLAGGTSC